MSESREHKRRYNLRLEFIDAFAKWLECEPPMLLFWKWRKWKQERPDWNEFSKKQFDFYDPYYR